VPVEGKLPSDKLFGRNEKTVSERFRQVLAQAVAEAGGVEELARAASRYMEPSTVRQFLSGERVPEGQEIINLARVLKNPATGLPDVQYVLGLLGHQINSNGSHVENGAH
jgi:transcriptional regulator with XRE-family HTH domain